MTGETSVVPAPAGGAGNCPGHRPPPRAITTRHAPPAVTCRPVCFAGLRLFMHIHVLGICGTFMGSLAVLAKELGHHVTGSDANVYPPMSTQLEAQGIELTQGYDPAQLDPA